MGIIIRALICFVLPIAFVHCKLDERHGLIRLSLPNDTDKEQGGGALSVGDNSTKEFCFFYQSSLYDLPLIPEKFYKIVDTTNMENCHNHSQAPADVDNNTLLLVQRGNGNCSIVQWLNFAKDIDSAGMFINLYDSKNRQNSTFGLEMFGAISNITLTELKKYVDWRSDVLLQIFSFDESFFDASIVMLWITACVCVAVGSLTGPYQDLQSTSSRQQILEVPADSEHEPKNVQLNFTVSLAMILVVFITATLMLLYFFFDYLVYFFMAIFCMASGRAMYEIWNQIFGVFKVDGCIPRIRGCGLHKLFFACICIATPIIWFIFRHQPNIWILQDVLGVCFCVHLVQTLRIPNLRTCSVLLSLLFVYDIFFVLVTPYFTKNGKSIMVEVATGGDSGETLPLSIKFPRMRGPEACISEGSYTILGFGDIIVPGFLVCFAHSFDIIRGDKIRPYFITTMIGYGIGLAVAFVALFISQTGQPALLYIVPCILIPILVQAAIRKQVRELWRGAITITEVEP